VSQLAIDRARCCGHGRCWTVAPDLFEPDDDGEPMVLRPEIGSEDHEDAVLAAEACPEQAVLLKETDD
jgi:ferredoxin